MSETLDMIKCLKCNRTRFNVYVRTTTVNMEEELCIECDHCLDFHVVGERK